MRRLFLFELNEFNRDLLKEVAQENSFKNILEVLSWPEHKIHTNDSDENDTLDPWVQWVSIHTGVPFEQHRVKRLGNVPDLKFPTIWESLVKDGVSCGIWGVLNAEMGANCDFFFPDPWTYSEPGYPNFVKNLVGFPRYLAKNRVGFVFIRTIMHFTKFIATFFRFPSVLFELTFEVPRILIEFARNPKPYALFSPAEYALNLIFFKLQKKYNPQFSILFLNGLAHLQHYHWQNKRVLAYGVRYVEKTLEYVLKNRGPEDAILFTNGFSQLSTKNDDPWFAYRPRVHREFLAKLQIYPKVVEELMSYDAQLEFETERDREVAVTTLETLILNGKKLLFIEENTENSKKLFYRVQYTDAVGRHDKVSGKNLLFEFNKFFTCLGSRTGKHCASGSLYALNCEVPKKLSNHEIYSVIKNFFGDQSAKKTA